MDPFLVIGASLLSIMAILGRTALFLGAFGFVINGVGEVLGDPSAVPGGTVWSFCVAALGLGSWGAAQRLGHRPLMRRPFLGRPYRSDFDYEGLLAWIAGSDEARGGRHHVRLTLTYANGIKSGHSGRLLTDWDTDYVGFVEDNWPAAEAAIDAIVEEVRPFAAPEIEARWSLNQGTVSLGRRPGACGDPASPVDPWGWTLEFYFCRSWECLDDPTRQRWHRQKRLLHE